MTTTQKPQNIASNKHHHPLHFTSLPFPSLPSQCFFDWRTIFTKSHGKKKDPNSPDFEDFKNFLSPDFYDNSQ
jgi:hypothetical protein